MKIQMEKLPGDFWKSSQFTVDVAVFVSLGRKGKMKQKHSVFDDVAAAY